MDLSSVTCFFCSKFINSYNKVRYIACPHCLLQAEVHYQIITLFLWNCHNWRWHAIEYALCEKCRNWRWHAIEYALREKCCLGLASLAVRFILKRCFICSSIHSRPADVHFREDSQSACIGKTWYVRSSPCGVSWAVKTKLASTVEIYWKTATFALMDIHIRWRSGNWQAG